MRSNQLSYRPGPARRTSKPDKPKRFSDPQPVRSDEAKDPFATKLDNGRDTKTATRRDVRTGISPKENADILRKEVIQPQVPLRLPCYDFTPVADYTVVKVLKLCLKVEPTPMV